MRGAIQKARLASTAIRHHFQSVLGTRRTTKPSRFVNVDQYLRNLLGFVTTSEAPERCGGGGGGGGGGELVAHGVVVERGGICIGRYLT